MRHLIIGLLLAMTCVSAKGAPPSYDHWAIWSVEDESGKLTIELRADGKCSIALAHPKTEAEERVPCTYWVHGGRVRLRARGERIGEGFGALQIEHLRDPDTLVILGETPKVLVRQWKYWEK